MTGSIAIDSGAARVSLPGGFWSDGALHRDVWLRPLTGEDEVFLVEAGAGMLAAHRVSALLRRCLIGAPDPASLTVGDREALMLHLRRLTFGDAIRCVLTCPRPDCGSKMDLDLSVASLLLAPYNNVRQECDSDVAGTLVRFRLPTGADQEAVAALARNDPAAAGRQLVARCVLGEYQEGLYEPLSALFSELDPQAELRLTPECPSCGRSFSTILDAATFLFQEIAARYRNILREIHLLASRYHWSESQILSTASSRRRAYCAMFYEEAAAGAT